MPIHVPQDMAFPNLRAFFEYMYKVERYLCSWGRRGQVVV
jgi:hypothetical protein